jgi:hypothetical protein
MWVSSGQRLVSPCKEELPSIRSGDLIRDCTQTLDSSLTPCTAGSRVHVSAAHRGFQRSGAHRSGAREPSRKAGAHGVCRRGSGRLPGELGDHRTLRVAPDGPGAGLACPGRGDRHGRSHQSDLRAPPVGGAAGSPFLFDPPAALESRLVEAPEKGEAWSPILIVGESRAGQSAIPQYRGSVDGQS